MRLLLRFLGMVVAVVGVIVALGAVASIATGGPLVGLTIAVSIGSMIFGSLLLSGQSKPKEEYRSVYATSSIAGSLAWGRLEQESPIHDPTFNTPSNLSSRTRIEPGARSWLTGSSLGLAMIVAEIVVVAILLFATFM